MSGGIINLVYFVLGISVTILILAVWLQWGVWASKNWLPKLKPILKVQNGELVETKWVYNEQDKRAHQIATALGTYDHLGRFVPYERPGTTITQR